MSSINQPMNIETLSYYKYLLQEELIENCSNKVFKPLFLTMVFITLTVLINYFTLYFKFRQMKIQLKSSHYYYKATKKLQKDRDNIEEIMVDGAYNDNEYLGYEGDEWDMKKLKEKAKSLNIPNFYFSSKKAYSYIIRIVEQLSRIENIIEPNYPDGYETEEMCNEDDP